jgi:hypothetical protein
LGLELGSPTPKTHGYHLFARRGGRSVGRLGVELGGRPPLLGPHIGEVHDVEGRPRLPDTCSPLRERERLIADVSACGLEPGSPDRDPDRARERDQMLVVIERSQRDQIPTLGQLVAAHAQVPADPQLPGAVGTERHPPDANAALADDPLDHDPHGRRSEERAGDHDGEAQPRAPDLLDANVAEDDDRGAAKFELRRTNGDPVG